jgi:hypothetical protein
MFEYGTNNPTCDGSGFNQAWGTEIGTGEWHHLAMTYDGANILVYYDGQLVDTTALASGFCSNSGSDFRLVNSVGTGIVLVDEPQVYKRVLSASEIESIYNAGK